jgi:N-acetyl-anhydromuramyl-L-alanine amidase AmpD
MENGLAYHFVIGNGVDSRDGEIEIGPRWLKQIQGGHVHREEINEVGIGICLVGNFERTRPTLKQMAAFQELVDYLRSEVVGTKIRFAVHKEIDPGRTACPGRFFPTAQMHRLYGGPFSKNLV